MQMASPDKSVAGIGPERLLAFSDGVFAIIITIMVLELKVPHTPDWTALLGQWPLFLAYALSYLQVGIYWVNHHALFAGVERVTHRVLWSNLLVLFFLSLVPFATAFAGETAFAPLSTAVYALMILLPGTAWLLLHSTVIAVNPGEANVIRAANLKAYVGHGLYIAAIAAALFGLPYLALVMIVVVTVMYFIPMQYF
jgi:uncharacterized membrane protein